VALELCCVTSASEQRRATCKRFHTISGDEVNRIVAIIAMTITLGSSCDSPGMSAMPGSFIFKLLISGAAEGHFRRVLDFQKPCCLTAIESR
jgi:hypothetical protein